ncbi:MAG: NADH-quinone oxidoreductase subunit J [Candidatus Poribacteria bacterium]
MIQLVLGMVVVVTAVCAVFLNNIYKAVTALWGTGVAVGFVYILYGAETLAIVQWITSTLVTGAFIIAAALSGEQFWATSEKKSRSFLVTSIFLGLCFAVVVFLGIEKIIDITTKEHFVYDTGLTALGKMAGGRGFISLEMLAFILLVALIGTGFVVRTSRPMASNNIHVAKNIGRDIK